MNNEIISRDILDRQLELDGEYPITIGELIKINSAEECCDPLDEAEVNTLTNLEIGETMVIHLTEIQRIA